MGKWILSSREDTIGFGVGGVWISNLLFRYKIITIEYGRLILPILIAVAARL